MAESFVERLYVNDDVVSTTSTGDYFIGLNGDTFRMVVKRTITNSDDPGYPGEICIDDDYIYYCVSTDSWKRVAMDSWGSFSVAVNSSVVAEATKVAVSKLENNPIIDEVAKVVSTATTNNPIFEDVTKVVTGDDSNIHKIKGSTKLITGTTGITEGLL